MGGKNENKGVASPETLKHRHGMFSAHSKYALTDIGAKQNTVDNKHACLCLYSFQMLL